MIFKNMIELHISSVKNVIKVGDTISDIQEGVNAGVIAVGVIEGSSTLGLNEEEFNALTPKERNRAIERVKEAYLDAGADYVINNLSEQLKVITGFAGVTLQPNSGAAGEYTGLRIIALIWKVSDRDTATRY